jgi:hypothetical protein
MKERNKNAPIDDPALVEVLQRQQDFRRIELRPTRCELFALDVEHEISAGDVLHYEINSCFRLEAGVQAEEEGVALPGGGEEDALFGFGAVRTEGMSFLSVTETERGRTTRLRRSR